MVEIFDSVLDQQQIDRLLEFYHLDDETVDDRLDVRSKIPGWEDHHSWPGALVQAVLDRVLPEKYQVEVVLFYGSRISFRLHVDSGDDDGQPIYKNILIPLYHEGPATTVLFDNYWDGPHTRFGRIIPSPFQYSLPDQSGKMKTVDDVRLLLKHCLEDAGSVKDFKVDDAFIQQLRRIVDARSGINAHRPDGYVSDYSRIRNYQPGAKFDALTHQKYLSHLPIENLHGLTVDRVIPWVPGQVIVFDRNQLHCAGSGHDFKVGITIFTHRGQI